MSLYFVTASALAVTQAVDLFEIVAPSTTMLKIREIRIGQYSDAGDAQAELLSVILERGCSTSGSGGVAGSAVNQLPFANAAASTATIEIGNTTQAASDGKKMIADVWNVQAPWLYMPDPKDAIIVDKSQRFVVRLSAPADSITVNATLIFENAGQWPLV